MEQKIKGCCFTGYRPNKMPFISDVNDARYKRVENKLIDAIFSMADRGCTTFYSGMAMGFDIVAADCVLFIKSIRPDYGIRLVCAIPFEGQASKYPPEWLERYEKILADADERVVICDSYRKDCYQRRNEYMVDNCDVVITWFDGKSGGTKNTLKYAERKEKEIINLEGDGVHEYLHEDDYIVIFEGDDGEQLGLANFQEM